MNWPTPPIIHVTQDYDKFKLFNYNRKITHKQKLYKSIDKCNKLYVHPIIVTKDFEIIDGQHRWSYAKDRGVALYYITDENYETQDLISHNNTASNWRSSDFTTIFSQSELLAEENKNVFCVLKKLNEQYQFNFDLILSGFCFCVEKSRTVSLKAGTLKLKFSEEETFFYAERLFNLIQFLGSLKIRKITTEHFLCLLNICKCEDYSEEKFIMKLDDNVDDVALTLKFRDRREIVDRFLAIYNKNSKKNLVIPTH